MRIKIEKIKILNSYFNNKPKDKTMEKANNYYREHGKFKDPVVLNSDLYLLSGYTTYLIAKNNHVDSLECVVLDSDLAMTKEVSSNRQILMEQYDGKCAYCGKKLQNNNPDRLEDYMTINRIRPKAIGGRSSILNYQPLCRRCNAAKQDMDESEFEELIFKICRHFIDQKVNGISNLASVPYNNILQEMDMIMNE